MKSIFLILIFLSFSLTSCNSEETKVNETKLKSVFNSETSTNLSTTNKLSKNNQNQNNMENNTNLDDNSSNNLESSKIEEAIFAAGCFWCVEAVFQRVEGVISQESGYIGGKIKNPTYEQICTGTTDHAEAIRIKFNPNVISYDELLEIFWTTHDPTTLNRQGNDVGTQYRSAIFYTNNSQKEKAEFYLKRLNEELTFGKKVVTEITKASEFYIAEKYHQDYYNQNSNQSYCAFVIAPKIEKLNKVFKHKLKKK